MILFWVLNLFVICGLVNQTIWSQIRGPLSATLFQEYNRWLWQNTDSLTTLCKSCVLLKKFWVKDIWVCSDSFNILLSVDWSTTTLTEKLERTVVKCVYGQNLLIFIHIQDWISIWKCHQSLSVNLHFIWSHTTNKHWNNIFSGLLKKEIKTYFLKVIISHRQGT